MKTIKVRTEKAFERKCIELSRLFFESEKATWEPRGKILGEISRINKHLRTYSMSLSSSEFKKHCDQIQKLERLLKIVNSKVNPRQYPDGVLLVFERKCPYCDELKVYSSHKEPWLTNTPGINIMVGRAPVVDPRTIKIKKLNPGICPDCVSGMIKSMDKPRKKKQSKGFWGSIFD